jgi:trans-2,3-dihydro-3-hydroxyanthranilate isomerase
VIGDADGLDDDAMLRVARETRLSETTFVQSPGADGADYRNRIFTIAGELPFAGHPSLGTAVVVARARGERSVRYVQQTVAGLQPVGVELTQDGRRASAWMLQEPAVFGVEVDRAKAMAAAGLFPEDAHPALQPQVVSTGVPHVIAPVGSDGALARAAPDGVALAALLDGVEAVVLYIVALDPERGRAHARGLTPSVTGGEDPATGSAAGPLCAYTARRIGTEQLVIEQGLEMGRPSRLEAEIEGDRVRVAGEVVVLVDGFLHL